MADNPRPRPHGPYTPTVTGYLWAFLIPAQLFVLRLAQRRLFWDTERVLGHRWLAYAVAMPGTAAHELAHAWAAVLVRVRIGEVRLFRPSTDPKTGALTLGYVQVAQTDPLRGAWISIAPVIWIPAAMVGMSYLLLGTLDPFSIAWTDLAVWKVAIWLLLGATLSMAAFPSPGDHIGVIGGVCLIVAVGLLALLLSQSGQLDEALALVAQALIVPATWAAALLAILGRR